jgi:hypothetical protein
MGGVMKWITGHQIGHYTVERHDLPRSGGQDWITLATLDSLVVHTTEGHTLGDALAVMTANFDGVNWLVGEDRILQGRPIGAQGGGLRDNGGEWHPNSVGQQVECVGFSKQHVYQLPDSTWWPLVALVGFLHSEHGVPLRRPEGWADDCSDITTILATDNTRRQSRKAVGFHGLLGHIDIPDQAETWHWDPGALDYIALIDQAGDDMQLSDKVTISRDPPEEMTVEQVLARLIQASRTERERDAAERARNGALLHEVERLRAHTPDAAGFAEAVSKLLHARLGPTPEPGVEPTPEP